LSDDICVYRSQGAEPFSLSKRSEGK
jgi:hypothetical protein